MAHNIILISDLSTIAAPLERFIASWAALHSYGKQAVCNDNANVWRSTALAWRMSEQAGMPTSLHSIELLCRLASNASSWSIANDPAFGQRNQRWLTDDGRGGAKLSTASLAAWDVRSPQQRQALMDEADGNVFALVVAHGSRTE